MLGEDHPLTGKVREALGAMREIDGAGWPGPSDGAAELTVRLSLAGAGWPGPSDGAAELTVRLSQDETADSR